MLLQTTLVDAAAIGVAGLFRDKALVSIDGASPRMMSVGQSVGEVKLLSADSRGAVFEVDGQRRTLGMGQSISIAAKASTRQVALLSPDGRGHYITTGAVNGGSVNFLLDTGASSVTLPAAEARRLGIKYQEGEMLGVSTANGVIPAWRVMLDSVKVGGITLYGVEGLVVETQMAGALLGMSFLNRTDMKREGQVMTLTLRY